MDEGEIAVTEVSEIRQRVDVSQSGTQSSIAEELARIVDEPFLPVEAKLVGWSLGVGAILLGVLIWVSYTFFGG